MNRDERIRIKLIFIFCGILFLAFLAVVNIGNMRKISQKQGEYIPLYRVLLLLETVEPSLGEKEELSALQQNDSEFLTYGQYLSICKVLSESGDGQVQYPLFKKEYLEEYYMTKDDFNTMYSLFLQEFDKEGKMQLLPVTILGNRENCVLPEGEEVKEGEVLTAEGIYEAVDKEIPGYRFQKVELYYYDGKLITINQVLDTQCRFSNIWVTESNKEGGIRFFSEGRQMVLLPQELGDGIQEKIEREQVADLEFEKGILQKGKLKTEKLNGKILCIKDDSITLEGKGEFPVSDKFCVYKLYGTLEKIEKSDLIIGYDFTDFVIEDGKICAGLVIKEEKMPYIRVLLKNADYAGIGHKEVSLSSDTEFSITYGTAEEQKVDTFSAGEKVDIGTDSKYFKGQRVIIAPTVLSGKVKLLHLNRSQGIPEYRGKIELSLEDGNIYIVNEVLLEEYLYSVVPSEMPASYPVEALKAQAVCARTYAYAKMLHSPLAWYGAHVDDSTSYQVYNNIAEREETTTAVKETAGALLYVGDELAGTYYYSTSCGFGTDAGIWENGTETMPYLQSKQIGTGECTYTPEQLQQEDCFESFIENEDANAFEKEENYYRWSYEVENIDSTKIEERLKKRYEVNKNQILTQNEAGEYESKAIKNLGEIQDIYVETRKPGGVAYELIIKGEKVQIKVITEYNIRYVLNNGETKVKRKDNKEVDCATLLPSAFFTIATDKEEESVVGYTIRGGGYGHGVGMSQNGARTMAASGWKYEDILLFFYEGGNIEAIY